MYIVPIHTFIWNVGGETRDTGRKIQYYCPKVLGISYVPFFDKVLLHRGERRRREALG
jgi:hypothetical protein